MDVLLLWSQCILIKNDIFEKVPGQVLGTIVSEPISHSPSCLESKDQFRKLRKDLRKKAYNDYHRQWLIQPNRVRPVSTSSRGRRMCLFASR